MLLVKTVKTKKIAIFMILVTVAVMIAPASAYFSGQNVETKAERMVSIAEQALERVNELIVTTENNETVMLLLQDAELDDDFEGNASLCEEGGEGLAYLTAAQEALLVAQETEEYEAVIDNAREALEIFRDVLRAINGMLIDVGVEPCPTCDAETIQEAIERALDRIARIEELIDTEAESNAEMVEKLADAKVLLEEAQTLLPDEVDQAKTNLQAANELISEVCQDIRDIAQELNGDRIRGYLEKAYQRRERFRERMRNTWNTDEDIDEFLQRLGYENEEEFMAQFQEMIQNAQDAENVGDAIDSLQEIGQTIRNMDNSLNEETGYTGGQDMPGNGSGFGDMGGGNGR
jgi:signal transduction histidine kinase